MVEALEQALLCPELADYLRNFPFLKIIRDGERSEGRLISASERLKRDRIAETFERKALQKLKIKRSAPHPPPSAT